MKTLHQRLQSRISLRRNLIRSMEAEITGLRDIRRITDNLDLMTDELCYMRNTKNLVVNDQKLDKELLALVLEKERMAALDKLILSKPDGDSL